MLPKPRSRVILVFAIILVVVAVGTLLYSLLLRQPQKVKQYYLVELKSIFSTPDTLERFFSKVHDTWLDEETGKLYVTDIGTNCIVVFDTNLVFLYRIGRTGDAANEFRWPMYVRSRDNMIYVSDVSHSCLKVLKDGGEYARSIRLTWPQLMYPFAIDSTGRIVANAPFSDDSLLVVYDTSGRIVARFGQRIKRGSEAQTLRQNLVSPVVGEDGSIYVVFLSLPYIRKYSRDFQLVMEKDLSSAGETRYGRSIIRKAEIEESPRMIHSVVNGVYYRRPYLYVVYPGELPHGATIFAYDAKTLQLRQAIMTNLSA
ncbi:MAG: hypothetical protein ACPL7O_12685, partial [Armatimonadota bacterium]